MMTFDPLAVLTRSRSPEDDDGRIKTFRDMLACFGAYNLRVVGMMNGSLLVRNARHPDYDTWSICDNGGELNVEKVNDMASLRSLPYVAWGSMVDGGTMAYRVRCVLDGAPIDHTISLVGDLELLKTFGGAS